MAASVVGQNRRYQRAVDKLERLLATRAFEVKKVQLTYGYRERERAGKKLQRTSGRIHIAILEYNDAAEELQVAREPLSWAAVIHPSFLAELQSLRLSGPDIE